jgi:hypothetical protein
MYHDTAACVAPAGAPTRRPCGDQPPSRASMHERRRRVAAEALDREFAFGLGRICAAAPSGIPGRRMLYSDAMREVPRIRPLHSAFEMCCAALDEGKAFDAVYPAALALPEAVRAYYLAHCEETGRSPLPPLRLCYGTQQREQAEADIVQADVVIAEGRLTIPLLDRAIEETRDDISASMQLLDRMLVERAKLVAARGERRLS